jgi:nucleoside-diphosphate-sugar epimerase
VWEAVDVRLLADALAWAATAPQAANGTFNITNGDVFEWRDLWPALAETLGVEVGPDRPPPSPPTCRRKPECGTGSWPSTACSR